MPLPYRGIPERIRNSREGKRGIHAGFTGASHIEPVIDAGRVNQFPQEDVMSKDQIRIELTKEQKDQVRKATGKDAEAVELSVEELEDRIAPAKVIPRHG